MKTTKLIRALVSGGLIGLVSISSFAVGLGRLTVQSSLGQPLNAEIELLSVQSGELDTISARVAPSEAFQEAKVEYSPALNTVSFKVETKAGGQPYLRVTSKQPVEDPFLNMLVEVRWSAGHLVREFPVLLDPPGFSPNKPTVAKSKVTPAPVKSEEAVASTKPIKSTKEATSESSAVKGSGENYSVKSGDTLSKIASRVKPADVNLDQMLVSLFRSNPQAFVGSNMNRLKRGVILKIPSAAEASTVSPSEARKEIRAQSANWQTYRSKLAGTAIATHDKASSDSASGKITKGAVETPAAPASNSKDVLKISKNSEKTGADKGLQDKVNALREEAIARENQLKEDKARIAQLEKNISEMERLLALKTQTMAELQKQAEENKKSATAKPAQPLPSAESPKPTPEPKAVELPPVTPKEPEPAPPVTKPAEPPPSAEGEKKADSKKPDVVPPTEEPGLMDGLMENPIALAGAGGIAVLLLGLVGYGAYKRKQANANTNTGATSSLASDLQGTSPNNAKGGVVDTGNSSFLTDFEKTGPGIIDVEEVDPVAEAEVYIAYGRDAQAEEILKEAMAKDSSRHEISLKLLEIYANRKSVSSFEVVAKPLHDLVGSDHPAWAKAAEMGRKIDPSNMLYNTAETSTAKKDDVPASTEANADLSNVELTLPPVFSEPVAEEKVETIEEVSLPVVEEKKKEEEVATTLNDLDFDLDLPSDESASLDLPLPAEEKSVTKEETPSLDLSLDAEKVATPEPEEKTPYSAMEEGSSLDFDLSGIDLPKPVPDRPEPPASDQTMLVRPKFSAQFTEEDSLDLSDFSHKADSSSSNESFASLDPKVDLPLPDLQLDIPSVETKKDEETKVFAVPEKADSDAGIIPTAVEMAASEPSASSDSSSLNLNFSPESLDLDTASEDDNVDPEWQSVATKLDLAKAYLEIGDKDGAKEILQEVVQEGDAKQKSEAETMIATIA